LDWDFFASSADLSRPLRTGVGFWRLVRGR
jgi:hypothetical protein